MIGGEQKIIEKSDEVTRGLAERVLLLLSKPDSLNKREQDEIVKSLETVILNRIESFDKAKKLNRDDIKELMSQTRARVCFELLDDKKPSRSSLFRRMHNIIFSTIRSYMKNMELRAVHEVLENEPYHLDRTSEKDLEKILEILADTISAKKMLMYCLSNGLPLFKELNDLLQNRVKKVESLIDEILRKKHATSSAERDYLWRLKESWLRGKEIANKKPGMTELLNFAKVECKKALEAAATGEPAKLTTITVLFGVSEEAVRQNIAAVNKKLQTKAAQKKIGENLF